MKRARRRRHGAAKDAPEPEPTAASRLPALPLHQSRLLARQELLRQRLVELKDVQAFERRLELRRDVPGWRYVRQGRRALLRHFVQPQERAFAYLLLHQKALLHEIRHATRRARDRNAVLHMALWALLGLPYLLLHALAWAQQKVYFGVTRGQRLVTGHVVAFPDTFERGLTATRQELATAQTRRGLAQAFLDERRLTRRRRRAILFLALSALVAGWIVAEILVRTVFPGAIDDKRSFDLLFYYGAATRLFLPTPLEAVIPGAADRYGALGAILLAATGAVVGSWLLFLLGSTANKGLVKWLERRPWGRRFWSALKLNANRFGYALMGGILSIPFAPDSITILFTLLGLRLRWFLVTVFAATTLRLSLFLWVWRGATG